MKTCALSTETAQTNVKTESRHFRKKPVVIEAVQFTEDLAARMLIDREVGPWGLQASGNYHPERREVSRAWLTIRTLEGGMVAELGDWIIRGVKGELYPCKPDIFEATYGPADGTEVDLHRSEIRLIARIAGLNAINSELAEALDWYAEQAEGCRKLGNIGDPFRQALDSDGGKRARAALAKARGGA